jgi:hypothetical protein
MHGIFMSKERRYERALAALAAIARAMGNTVFRVEDYRPPREKRAQTGHGEQRGEAENPLAGKRASRGGI